ncbi:T9SS C-terminal target domain-containing protein [Bacteroidetes/Chlorobi group bacterium ChocPot_Mid]|jgi:hypothetical protein|nr:MAG: T9SS C-terminal target domain-containing protein [Bacteroidetes/Chlorobi group bacterium ChocPot_Mid]
MKRISLVILLFVYYNLYSQITFESESDKNCYYNFLNNDIKIEEGLIKNEKEISTNSDTLEFEILDSFDLHRDHLHDLTYGDGFLWIIRSNESEYDTIFKINPVNGEIVNLYQIPLPLSYWSQGLAWDSTSSGGPYFWFTTDNPKNEIYQMKVSDFEIIKRFKSPEIYSYGIDFLDSCVWITVSGNNAKLFKFNIITEIFDTIINLIENSNRFCFSSKKSLIWVHQHNFPFNMNLVFLLDIKTGLSLKCYRTPLINFAGITIDKNSLNGPFLWFSDFRTGMIYKVKEPIINSIDTNIIQRNNITIITNPFEDEATLKIEIQNSSLVKLDVFDLLGKKIINLVDEYLKSGTYEFTFDGSSLASGAYFLVLQADGKVETGKLVLIK